MPESRAVTHAVALARQPIFDREDRLHGYELLSRDSPLENRAVARPGVSPTAMSSDTITRAFLDLGIADVTHGRLAFLNVDRTMLLDGSVEVLDPRTVVLELLETIACDPEVLAACTTLVAKGYTLALDDFVYDETYDPLLRLVRIVKIDTLGRSDAELRDVLAKVHPFGVRRLAERVESAADHARCLALGFDLFQGYFYARPEMLSGQRVPTQQARLIRLLNLLRDSHASDALVEAEFRADPKLSYQLLRIVNSAGVGHSGVTSIGHALRLLGRGALHRWLGLLLVSSCATENGVRREVVATAIVRAHHCEVLAEATGRRRDGGALFMAGLFSRLDALLRVPMSDLLDRMELAPELRAALSSREGPYARVLGLVESYEAGAWDVVQAGATGLGVSFDVLPALYAQAVTWAREQAAEATGG